MTEADYTELATLYAEDTGLSERVCEALLRADIDPPHRSRVDRVGYTAAEDRALQAIRVTTAEQTRTFEAGR